MSSAYPTCNVDSYCDAEAPAPVLGEIGTGGLRRGFDAQIGAQADEDGDAGLGVSVW